MAQVMTDTWELRRVRTAVLRDRYPFTAEMLDLYAELLPVQEAAFLDAITSPPRPQRIASYVADQVVPGVVEVTMVSGPERLRAALADRLAEAGAGAMVEGWMRGDGQHAADRYLARAALSPVLEAIGELAAPAFEGPRDQSHCPFCGGPPQLSYFAVPVEDLASGSRRLVCARCHGEWGYPRMTCTSCGEQSGSRLPVYSEVGTAAGERGGVVRGLGMPTETDALFPHMRIEACETCRRYLLNIDLAGDAQAVPLVDELSALPLDLYARDLGFTKITPNLMGF
jgi:hypothetical protein